MTPGWCECDKVTTVFRDGKSTCGQCGGIDAYKGHKDNPVNLRATITKLEEEVDWHKTNTEPLRKKTFDLMEKIEKLSHESDDTQGELGLALSQVEQMKAACCECGNSEQHELVEDNVKLKAELAEWKRVYEGSRPFRLRDRS